MTDVAHSPFEQLTWEQLRSRRSAKWLAHDPDVLPVWVAEMDVPLAPPIARVLHEAVERGDTGYAWEGGLPAAFAEFARRRYGWNVSHTAPRLTADVMRAVSVAVEAVTRPGDSVVINTPVYPPFFACLDTLRRSTVASPLRHADAGLRLDLDRLERDFAAGARCYLLCNPHNPSGAVFSRAELQAVADLAAAYDVAVVSDEIHAPLTAPGVAHIPFATVDGTAAARSFTAVAASKAWNLPGLKAALLIPGPDSDVAALPGELWAGAGLFGVLAGEAAFTHGEQWLDQIRADVEERKTLLAKLLAEDLPQVGYVPQQGTYLAWLDFRDCDLPGDPATVLCDRGRVGLSSGPAFGVEGEGFARLNLATSRANLVEAVRRIRAAID